MKLPDERTRFQTIFSMALVALLIYWWREVEAALYVAGALMAIGLFLPKAAGYIVVAFIWIGERIGKVNVFILLSLTYYLILTPLGLIKRLGKTDAMGSIPPENSNWKKVSRSFAAKDFKDPW